MRLYSTTGASSVSNEDHGTFDVDPETGAVEVPHGLGEILHNIFLAGKRAWENEEERFKRLTAAELERRKDPATLLDAVEKLTEKVAGSSSGDGGSSPAGDGVKAVAEMTVKELKSLAEAAGIDVGKAKTKADLQATIEAAKATLSEPVAETEPPSPVGADGVPVLTAPEAPAEGSGDGSQTDDSGDSGSGAES